MVAEAYSNLGVDLNGWSTEDLGHNWYTLDDSEEEESGTSWIGPHCEWCGNPRRCRVCVLPGDLAEATGPLPCPEVQPEVPPEAIALPERSSRRPCGDVVPGREFGCCPLLNGTATTHRQRHSPALCHNRYR
ncbi:hypothetical protein SKAU_G00071790 [Synaphobranchus kaupii]|uniref:Uncharacterized protein n=1 Tax=Synaphobranchus kaupii TaxID=118154 RepID=A0A9Q1G824_SYNKA|nr:hypothetical protein SKAU_G00071790 [Synaphobranchus kaupii]